ncbi:MAG TPA: ribosome silencing factor [Phycisphaerae bacterium]|nr:ribosome silencing factor [Phycisphaerae bacterium]
MVKKPTTRIPAVELAAIAARLAEERHCTDIVVLDLRRISPVTDYFVIATGTSNVQMRAIADELIEQAGKLGHRPFGVAGRETGMWVLLDFVDVVVHLFDEEHRQYYDLELMWGDAPRVPWERAAGGGPEATGERQNER